MIYSGPESANREPLNVSRLVEEMLALLKSSIGKRPVLKVNLQQHLPPVRGNASQIRRLVMNLITNASEAIGGHAGVIRVSTSCLSGGAANPSRCDYIRLEISDTGCGLSDEAKTRIYDPFFTTKLAGRGLGLAVVQGIVRAHGGAIHVASAPGVGTTFQVHLPCAKEQMKAAV